MELVSSRHHGQVDRVRELEDRSVGAFGLDELCRDAGLGGRDEGHAGARREGQRPFELDLEEVVELHLPDLPGRGCCFARLRPEQRCEEAENREAGTCESEAEHGFVLFSAAGPGGAAWG